MCFSRKLFISVLLARLLGGAAAYAVEFEVLDRLSVDGYTVLRGSADIPGGSFAVGGSTFVVKSGSVGIGTIAPKANLEIGSGSVGTNLSTGIIVNGGNLGEAAGNYIYPVEIQNSAGNRLRLQFAPYRRIAGASWQGTAYRIQYAVDNSFTNGSKAYVELGGDDSVSSGGGFISLGTLGSDRLVVTNAGSVGIGTTAPEQMLTVGGNISQTGVLVSSGSGNNYFAGNVSIGTTTAGGKLYVKGLTAGTNSLNSPVRFGESSTGTPAAGFGSLVQLMLDNSANSQELAADFGAVWIDAAAGAEKGAFIVRTRSSGGATMEKLRVTDSGYVGIGTTNPQTKLAVNINDNPGTAEATLKGDFQLARTGSGAATAGGLELKSSEYGSGYGTRLTSIDLSGTVGFLVQQRSNSAAWTNQMFINGEDGDVGIGTLTPSAKLEAEADSGGATTNNLTLSNRVADVAGTGVSLNFVPNGATGILRAAAISSVQPQTGNYADLRFATAAGDVPAERMRITPAGNVGIGTTAPGKLFEVRGESVFAQAGTGGAIDIQPAAGGATIWTNAAYNSSSPGSGWASALTLTNASAGIGTSYTAGKLNFQADTTGILISATRSDNTIPGYFKFNGWGSFSVSNGFAVGYDWANTAKTGMIINGNVGIGTSEPGYKLHVVGIGATSATHSIVVRPSGDAVNNFLIRDDGYGYLKAASWAFGSDRRLKENINYIQTGLDIVQQLKPAKFDYIGGEKAQAGFIAQEVRDVLPDTVTAGPDGMLALKTDSIIPYLVKAIQEQQKRIEALETKLSTGK